MDMTLTKALSFRMFVDKLLSFQNSVSQLQDEVNEMICLWEALFPDSQNFFQMHQIMDLVSSIVSKQKIMSCRGRGGSGRRDGGGGAGSLTALCENSIARNGSVPVNLLLLDFYDGGQLFHYATCDLWGLFTSILNLPPAFREMSCRGRGGSRRGG